MNTINHALPCILRPLVAARAQAGAVQADQPPLTSKPAVGTSTESSSSWRTPPPLQERFGMTELRKQANRMMFNQVGGASWCGCCVGRGEQEHALPV